MKLATDQPRAPSLNPKNVKKCDDGDGDGDDDDDNDEDIDELLREIGIVKLGGNCFASPPYKNRSGARERCFTWVGSGLTCKH